MEFKSRRSAIMARNGMAASTHPLASAAGLRVLMEGGNAIDAAVAMAAVLNVAEPWATGVGGDAFALVWTAREKKVRALNASGRSPAAASLDELRSQGLIQIPLESAYSVTVPGVVSAWEAIVKRYGTMPLSELLRPAISYAKDGYAVHELGALLWEVAGGEKLRRRPSGGELLLNGRPPRAG
ncbi:MAG: gamma-glutamyltransferase, partial [Chloroflexi bacterium]|nr:gamma-glutamyltransferase [Chloroflexota bacterium]